MKTRSRRECWNLTQSNSFEKIAYADLPLGLAQVIAGDPPVAFLEFDSDEFPAEKNSLITLTTNASKR